MPEQLLDQARVDRNAFSASNLAEAEQATLDYWRHERLMNVWKPSNSAVKSLMA